MSHVPTPSYEGYVHGGARALVQLHERHLRSFVEAWKQARDAGVRLPDTEDATCASLEAMLRHVLGASRGYLLWLCERLERSVPDIPSVPEDVTTTLDDYVTTLVDAWDGPLKDLTARAADQGVYPSRWGTEYCIDAMLEHAVMHPIRHELQLERARS